MEMRIDVVYCFFVIINLFNILGQDYQEIFFLFCPCKLKVTIALSSLASSDIKYGLII